MRIGRMSVLFGLFLTMLQIPMFGQYKVERESRISKEEVPKKAQEFIAKYKSDRAIKWYLEEGSDGYSYEAKFKYHKERYSVEFDSIGRLEDIEVEIPWNDMDGDRQCAIIEEFQEKCQKYRVQKIQRQYLYSGTDPKYFNPEEMFKLGRNYEIVLKCQNDNDAQMNECLFDSKGKLLKIVEIIDQNSSHLEY